MRPRDLGVQSTYVDCYGIIAFELDNRLTTRLVFDPVLRPEPGHHLDGVRTGHCGAIDTRRDQIVLSSMQAAGRESMRFAGP